MPITINEDTTFLISDERGDVPTGGDFGLYREDTRFLSWYALTLDGEPPLPLAAHATEHFSASHVLTNAGLTACGRGTLGISRRRLIGQGLHEDIDITNYGDTTAAFTLELGFDSDFAHIFEVKRNVEIAGAHLAREEAPTLTATRNGRRLRFRYQRDNLLRQLAIRFSVQPTATGRQTRFALRLAPRETWHLCLDFLTAAGAERVAPRYTCREGQSQALRDYRERHRERITRLAPELASDAYVVRRAYQQSVYDFAALQIKGEDVCAGTLAIAAGIPWFMGLFGRDALIASYQALPFYPNEATNVLRTLARLQGTRVDPLRAEEPGKILHEHRYGVLTGTHRIIPAFPYYGSVDATPLFLMVLAGIYHITGATDAVRALRDNAVRALAWMEHYGDRDGDGYLEYMCEGAGGLKNQGWKDSVDAVRFHDGQLARPPIALCEAQGYAYAARIGMADVFDALGEPERAKDLRATAAALKARFNRDFWLPERGYYALALDGDKRPVDALTSNPGHLLWTGIADPEKAAPLAERLLAPASFSGWGVRTMAVTEGGYNPISYHNGSIWPHDNSLLVAGLVRYGLTEAAAAVSGGLLAALGMYPDHRLPELFAGFSRAEAPFPVEYPTANRPQAWASGSVFLLLACMLGLDVTTWRFTGAPFLPAGIEWLTLDGLWQEAGMVAVTARRTADGHVTRELGASTRLHAQDRATRPPLASAG